MPHPSEVLLVALVAVFPAACASPPVKAAISGNVVMRQPLPRPGAFLKCVACHSTQADRHGIGPSLAGLAGRKAASLHGFAYSDALRNSGITWNPASLEAWLAAPQEAVPGMCMPFTGFSDPQKRKDVADYLLSLP